MKNGEVLPDIKTHKVVGETISLQLSLALEEAENIDLDIEGEAGSFVSEKATATIKITRENLLNF